MIFRILKLVEQQSTNEHFPFFLMDSFSIMLTRAKRYVHAYARAFMFSSISSFVQQFQNPKSLALLLFISGLKTHRS